MRTHDFPEQDYPAGDMHQALSNPFDHPDMPVGTQKQYPRTAGDAASEYAVALAGENHLAGLARHEPGQSLHEEQFATDPTPVITPPKHPEDMFEDPVTDFKADLVEDAAWERFKAGNAKLERGDRMHRRVIGALGGAITGRRRSRS